MDTFFLGATFYKRICYNGLLGHFALVRIFNVELYRVLFHYFNVDLIYIREYANDSCHNAHVMITHKVLQELATSQ